MRLKVLFGVMFLIAVIFLLGVYYFGPYSNLELSIKPRNYNFSTTNQSSMQFYNNLRFPQKEITYRIDTSCTLTKKQNMKDAFKEIENLTILSFKEVGIGEEIIITCNETNRYQKGMFIAGEGGPSKIIKSGKYNVILGGTILLIRDSTCERPNIAMHELLHVLGFTHSNNPDNLMYNFTKCSQVIGDDIIDLIDELYSQSPLTNLAIESASAKIDKRYLDLNVSIRNIGLAESENAKLLVKINDKTIKSFDITNLEIGEGVSITLTDLLIRVISFDEIELTLDTDFTEIDKQDNTLFLEIKK